MTTELETAYLWRIATAVRAAIAAADDVGARKLVEDVLTVALHGSKPAIRRRALDMLSDLATGCSLAATKAAAVEALAWLEGASGRSLG
jgi:hypothetical protein